MILAQTESMFTPSEEADTQAIFEQMRQQDQRYTTQVYQPIAPLPALMPPPFTPGMRVSNMTSLPGQEGMLPAMFPQFAPGGAPTEYEKQQHIRSMYGIRRPKAPGRHRSFRARLYGTNIADLSPLADALGEVTSGQMIGATLMAIGGALLIAGGTIGLMRKQRRYR